MNNFGNYRIFCCDGGGFRGYLTSKILEKIEKKLDDRVQQQFSSKISAEPTELPSKKLGDYFDMYAGTSTGALIACGLAQGQTAKDIKNIYERNGEKIFSKIDQGKEIRRRVNLFISTFSYRNLSSISYHHRFPFSSPLYDGSRLKEAIIEHFGEATKFGSLVQNNKKRVIITAYDCWNSYPVIFDTNKPEHQELNLVDVLMASAAYPGGFPAHSLDSHQSNNTGFFKDLRYQTGWSMPPDGSLALADGGLIANNPTMIALTDFVISNAKYANLIQIPNDLCRASNEVISNLPTVLVASFGTGRLLLRFDTDISTKMGLFDWTFPAGDPLMDIVYGGYSRITDRITWLWLKIINGGLDKYFRFQPFILGDEEKKKTWLDRSWEAVASLLPRNREPISSSVLKDDIPLFDSIPRNDLLHSLEFLPDLVRVKPAERRMYEQATFQFASKEVLDKIFGEYLSDESSSSPVPEEEIVKQNLPLNMFLPVNQRMEELVKGLLCQSVSEATSAC